MDVHEAKRRAASGPILLLARRAFGIIVSLVTTVTIARLISPREVGLATMSVVLFGFAQLFQEFGLTNAILRKGFVSDDEVSFLFWFNAVATGVLAAVLVALAKPMAYFYGESIVTYITWTAIVGFIIDGLSLQHRSLMSRDLRFKAIAMIDVVTMTVGFIVTLILAYLRHDVWAIVLGGLAQSLCASTLYVKLSGWTPGPPRRIRDIRDLLSFGVNSSVFSICMFFADNSATVIIGYFFGPSPLGQYTRAFALYRLPISNVMQPIVHSVMPLLARLRPHPEEYRKAYLDLVTQICAVLLPAAVTLCFVSVPLTVTILGERWTEAGRCFQMLAPSLGAYAIGYCAGDLFVTQNRMKEMRNLGIIEGLIRVLSLFAGLKFGLTGIAAAFTIANCVMATWKVIVAGHKGPVTIRDQFVAVSHAVPLAAGAAIGCAACGLLTKSYAISLPVVSASQILTAGVGAVSVGLAFPVSRAALWSLASLFGLEKMFRLLPAWNPTL